VLSSISIISGSAILWLIPIKSEILSIPTYQKIIPRTIIIVGATLA
jgi:hypothetical protein